MQKGTWVYRGGKLVEKGGPDDIRLCVPRSDLPNPMLIGDSMDAAEHVDGKFYTSKSEFRRVTKANGLTEVGNDPARFRKPTRPDRDKAIDNAVERAIARAS